jgi:hypothetical protein
LAVRIAAGFKPVTFAAHMYRATFVVNALLHDIPFFLCEGAGQRQAQ